MNNYDPKLAATGPILIGGLAADQLSLIAAALVLIGAAALAIRVFWRRDKSLSEG